MSTKIKVNEIKMDNNMKNQELFGKSISQRFEFLVNSNSFGEKMRKELQAKLLSMVDSWIHSKDFQEIFSPFVMQRLNSVKEVEVPHLMNFHREKLVKIRSEISDVKKGDQKENIAVLAKKDPAKKEPAKKEPVNDILDISYGFEDDWFEKEEKDSTVNKSEERHLEEKGKSDRQDRDNRRGSSENRDRSRSMSSKRDRGSITPKRGIKNKDRGSSGNREKGRDSDRYGGLNDRKRSTPNRDIKKGRESDRYGRSDKRVKYESGNRAKESENNIPKKRDNDNLDRTRVKKEKIDNEEKYGGSSKNYYR